MQDTDIRTDTIQAAAEAVTEYVTVAFQPEFLCWEKEVNLAVAEMVWNFHSAVARGEADEPVMHVAPQLQPLHDKLVEVRQARWPDADWMVLCLYARVEDGEIVFEFDLCWDEGGFRQPCEMTWVMNIAGPAQMN